MPGPQKSYSSSLPRHIVQRLQGGLESPENVNSSPVTAPRGGDAQAQPIDTWQPVDEGPRHETYRLHPDGTVSRSPGPRGASQEGQPAHGVRALPTSADPPFTGNPALDQMGGAPSTTSDEQFPASAPAGESWRPLTYDERMERDRKEYYDFFQQHPTQGNKQWYDAARRKLAEDGNLYAKHQLEEERRKAGSQRVTLGPWGEPQIELLPPGASPTAPPVDPPSSEGAPLGLPHDRPFAA